MKIKQRPEDFSVIESYRFEESRRGEYFVYRMDKQKLTTLDAVERIRLQFKVKRRDVSFCGLKDKQGRTEQLIAVKGKRVDLQDPDLKLTLLGRSDEPLSARNITSNRFSVIVRDLSEEDAERLPESIAEVKRVGVVNYFDSQRFGFVKHGQGFIAKDILRGDFQAALHALIAKPSELDRSLDASVKQWFADHWGEWDRTPPKGAAKYMPMLLTLREDPKNFVGALRRLDARLRAMVVFEFQSALWNDAVKRWLHDQIPGPDLVELRYQLGTLAFPRSLPRPLADGWPARTFPLLASDSTFTDPTIEQASKAALRKEKLTLEGLSQPKIDAFHFKHEERPLVVFPDKLRASAPAADEANQGRLKVTLSFTLPPGAYATLVVRRTLWYALPEHAGEAPVVRRPRVGKRAKRPREAREKEPVEAAEAKAPVEPVPAPEPKPARKGFLEQQRERKAARASARAAAKDKRS